MGSYQSWSVVFGEQPSAAKWNILGTNDSAFNDGTGIGTDAIKAASMFYGMFRSRQGGASGDASWQTAGTTTTATDGKDVYWNGGVITCSNSADTTVTFSNAFNFAPIVIAVANTATGANSFAVVKSITTTTFIANLLNTAGARVAENMGWIAIGQ